MIILAFLAILLQNKLKWIMISEAPYLTSQAQLIFNQRGVHNVLIISNAASPVAL